VIRVGDVEQGPRQCRDEKLDRPVIADLAESAGPWSRTMGGSDSSARMSMSCGTHSRSMSSAGSLRKCLP
jgi:hypothetical protein